MTDARTTLTARYGPSLWNLPEGAADRLDQAWHVAAALLAPSDAQGAELLRQQQGLRGWAADSLKRLPAWLIEVRALERWLALPLPAGAGATTTISRDHKLDPSPHCIKLFLRLAHLGMSDHPPERNWLTDSATLAAVQENIQAAKPLFTCYRQGRAALLQVYKEGFFELDLEQMAQRFAGPYRSWFRIFNGQYRRDRRAIRRRRAAGEGVPATVAADVTVGAQVLSAKKQLEAEAPRRAPLLGRYEKSLDTDIELAEKAAKVGVEALALIRDLGCSTPPAKLLDALSHAAGTALDKVRPALRRLDESYNAWARLTHDVGPLLPHNALPGLGAPLEACALSVLERYARDLQSSLNALAAATDPVLSRAPAPPTDLKMLLADLRQAEEIRRLEVEEKVNT